MKPVIGVIPLFDEKKDSLWMLPGYFDGIIEAGGLPLMLPLTDDQEMLNQAVEMCNGILFTGGHDTMPGLYGEEVYDPDICRYCPERDHMEVKVLQIAMEKDMAIFGICRGIQFINAALGGSLYQDLPTQHPSEINHRQKAPYDVPSHNVRILKDTPLYELVGEEILAVNSCHHQAVRELSPQLQPMAYSTDNLIEAVFHPGKHFMWAVQWHPEFSHKKDPISRKIFKTFIEAAD